MSDVDIIIVTILLIICFHSHVLLVRMTLQCLNIIETLIVPDMPRPQVVDVPMIDNRQCEQWHREKGINVIIYDEMVCAGYFHGGKVSRSTHLSSRCYYCNVQDSCQGDSGGPLMMEHEGRWTLIGLVRPLHASWARYQLKRQDVPTSARPRAQGLQFV